MPTYSCSLCDQSWEVTVDDLIMSSYWPGSVACQTIFDVDLFRSYRSLKLLAPGLSRQAFLGMLDDRTKTYGRVSVVVCTCWLHCITVASVSIWYHWFVLHFFLRDVTFVVVVTFVVGWENIWGHLPEVLCGVVCGPGNGEGRPWHLLIHMYSLYTCDACHSCRRQQEVIPLQQIHWVKCLCLYTCLNLMVKKKKESHKCVFI